MKIDYAGRLTAMRALFDGWAIDALLITSAVNRRWLTGFTGSAGLVLVTRRDAWLATDFRYYEQAQRQAPHCELFRYNRTDEAFQALAAPVGEGALGVEGQQITKSEWDKWSRLLQARLVALDETVEGLRQIKTAVEIASIRRAAAITDTVVGRVPGLVQAGMTERALAWELEKALREAGADGLAFDIIVAGGPNSARPHHDPGERPLTAGDALVIDMGARCDGYHSDLTRTFYLGDPASDRFTEIYGQVLLAHEKALAGLKPGLREKEADALARDAISAAGYGEFFGHGLGHGVGLEIHERPRLSARTDAPLAAGMVVTVEPGIYLPDWGGVRIEDLVLITDEGAERLSLAPKVPLIAV